ncbi:MAG: YibE/F family protein [Candidatus Kaiserbacteria bacterium]|nr:YibE/F family protein [Candidatus Kaiserbacteria bacterium]MCB9816399.1 YibE/F family protein [Candidatus Nomurabacteria bacterium]
MWQNSFSKWCILLFLWLPFGADAQEVHQDFKEQVRADVLEIVSEHEREITGTDAFATVQEVRAVLREGERAGEVVRFEHEFVPLEAGDHIFVNRTVTISGDEYITYADFERRPVLAILAGLFVILLLVLARWQGVRALLSLAASIFAIFFLLMPALLAGYDPVLASVVIAGGILALVLFGTHGFTPRSIIAFVGTFSAVVVTCLIAWLSTTTMRLSGFGSDASVYLNFATNGSLDLAGLLLGSIIIGILGVLDDVSITQASVVEQLKHANPAFQFSDLYQRAITVGRDHIGSLVNTLALAYVGVSLPLILLYVRAESSLLLSVNQEVVAAEIVRILVGSIGLMLAVPATTAVAAWYFSKHKVDEEPETSPCAHGHGHSH